MLHKYINATAHNLKLHWVEKNLEFLSCKFLLSHSVFVHIWQNKQWAKNQLVVTSSEIWKLIKKSGIFYYNFLKLQLTIKSLWNPWEFKILFKKKKSCLQFSPKIVCNFWILKLHVFKNKTVKNKIREP